MLSESQNGGSQGAETVISKETESQILGAIRSVRFGSVEVIVQDGKIVQIERKEKVRLKGQ